MRRRYYKRYYSKSMGKGLGKAVAKDPTILIFFFGFLILLQLLSEYPGIIWLIPLVIVGYFVYKKNKTAGVLHSGINEIDKMEGIQFEDYLAHLFEKLGYRVKKTSYNDFGADLIITNKQGIKTAVQAKRYSSNVGVSAIQEAVAGKNHYNCHRAMVVTNQDYTRQAKQLAQTNNVFLWERQTLIDQILIAQREKSMLERLPLKRSRNTG